MPALAHNSLRLALSLFAALFGLVTVFAGGSVALRFGLARDMAGDVVPFVVWFNFIAGFAYLAAAVGILRKRDWAYPLAFLIAFATGFVAIAFAIAAGKGHPYEIRTVGALGLRVLVWATIAAWLARERRT